MISREFLLANAANAFAATQPLCNVNMQAKIELPNTKTGFNFNFFAM